MQGEKRAGRFRIIQENNTVLFFNVWFSDVENAFVICELKFSEDGLSQNIDKSTKRVLTDAMWSRLVTWC